MSFKDNFDGSGFSYRWVIIATGIICAGIYLMVR